MSIKNILEYITEDLDVTETFCYLITEISKYKSEIDKQKSMSIQLFAQVKGLQAEVAQIKEEQEEQEEKEKNGKKK